MIKSHQTKVTSGDKNTLRRMQTRHTETKITSQDPLIYFFSFVSLLFFYRYCCNDYPIQLKFQGPLTMLRLIKVNKYTNK